jgi:hypothetical protein
MVLWLSVILAISGTVLFHAGERDRHIRKSVMIRPPVEIEHMTLGYDDLIADSLWIRLIQDYDLCEASNPNVLGSSPEKKCAEGWIFSMVNAITNLSPKFRMPYATGGTILSVLVEDYSGAEKIFAKAEKHFPNDYVFPYRAAYNYIYGLERPIDASQALIRASKLEGAPPWLPILAARQAKQGGKAELGLRILEELVGDHPDWTENPRIHSLQNDLVRLQKAELSPERQLAGKLPPPTSGKVLKSSQ